jgi:alpha-1,3/alpha-1,6-mannosyltransferase
MSLGTPVIAVNSGGPLETVKHNETGYLCEEDPGQFMEAMLKIAAPAPGDHSSKALGPNGITHVKAHFTNEVMRQQLEEYLQDAVAQRKKTSPLLSWLLVFRSTHLASHRL